MSEFGVEERDWPAKSSNLNLIEDIWDEVKGICEPGHLVKDQCLTHKCCRREMLNFC